MPLGIIYQPRLVAESVLKMVDDERQHIVVGRDHGEVGAVLRLLEADELLHPELFVHHPTSRVRHEEHVSIGKVARNVAFLPEHLAEIVEKRGGRSSACSDSQLTVIMRTASLDSCFSSPFHTLSALSPAVTTWCVSSVNNGSTAPSPTSISGCWRSANASNTAVSSPSSVRSKV